MASEEPFVKIITTSLMANSKMDNFMGIFDLSITMEIAFNLNIKIMLWSKIQKTLSIESM